MTLLSRIAAHAARLPPPLTRDVVVDAGLRVPMADGVELIADRYAPRGFTRGPVVLMRSPYERASAFASLRVRLLAERGFQVVMQSVRGTFGSGGVFEPFVHEQRDGAATLRWLRAQPWYDGTLATFGPSYVGYTQWALAPAAGPDLKAMALQVTASQFRDQTYPGESFSLRSVLNWIDLISRQERGLLRALPSVQGALRAVRHVPLSEADRVRTGSSCSFYQQWLEHNRPGSAYWASCDHSAAADTLSAAMSMVTGWYDLFLPWMLDDYLRLRAAGNTPRLVIGPWAHTDPGWFAASLHDTLACFRKHLLRDDSEWPSARPVRIHVMGANEWRDLPEWPPSVARPSPWYLRAERGLGPGTPVASEPDRYRYDPADPTPAVGGVWLGPGRAVVDNRPLERRRDVLVYSSEVLDRDVEVIGDVHAELYVKSSRAHTDFFARLCDVQPSGRSLNVCDGLARLSPGVGEPQTDGSLKISVRLWPTAYRFKRGHRIRLQVSSGSHPRFARNLGSDEPFGSARTLHVADQTVFHDPAHPSAVLLPVVNA